MQTLIKTTPKREVIEALGELSAALGECKTVLQQPDVPTEQLAICLGMIGSGVEELTKKVGANLMSSPDWTEKTLRVLSLAHGGKAISIVFEGEGLNPGVLLYVLGRDNCPHYIGLGSTLDRALEHATSKLSGAQLIQFAEKIEIGRD